MTNAKTRVWTILIVREDATAVTATVEAERQGPAFEEAARLIRDPFFRVTPGARVFMSYGHGLAQYGVGEVLREVGPAE